MKMSLLFGEKKRHISKVVEDEDGTEHVVNASEIIVATTNIKSI